MKKFWRAWWPLGVYVIVVMTMLAIVVLSFSTAYAAEDVKQMVQEMLQTTVKVEVTTEADGKEIGTGILVSSTQKDGKWYSYVITNHHVVEAAIKAKPSQLVDGKNVYQPVDLTWYDYNGNATHVAKTIRKGDIVDYDATIDLALIRVRDTERQMGPVVMISKAPQTLFEEVWAVGCGLGNDPFATLGRVSSLDMERGGTSFILHSASIIFGNSGGPLFHFEDGHYKVIGLNEAMARIRHDGPPVPTMGMAIPNDRLLGFLEKNHVKL